jgi:hypothetical protein
MAPRKQNFNMESWGLGLELVPVMEQFRPRIRIVDSTFESENGSLSHSNSDSDLDSETNLSFPNTDKSTIPLGHVKMLPPPFKISLFNLTTTSHGPPCPSSVTKRQFGILVMLFYINLRNRP